MPLSIPDTLVPFILFQRTGYLIVQNNALLNRFLVRTPFLTYNRYVGLEARLQRSRVKRMFSKDMEDEYERIRPFLPESARNILDVGSGIAGIDVMIDRHYAGRSPRPTIHLLDKSEVADKVYYGLEKKAAFYNSLDGARLFLESNGVEASRIVTAEATEDNRIPFGDTQFDLIISLISWGFHYPVDTYLDEAYERLSPAGTLIIDIRRGSGGEEKLRARFPDARIIYSAQKHDRFVARKA